MSKYSVNINALVAEAIGEKFKKIGKGAGIAAGVGALGVGADVIRRRMAGDTYADIGNTYIDKAKDVKEKVGRIFTSGKPKTKDLSLRNLANTAINHAWTTNKGPEMAPTGPAV